MCDSTTSTKCSIAKKEKFLLVQQRAESTMSLSLQTVIMCMWAIFDFYARSEITSYTLYTTEGQTHKCTWLSICSFLPTALYWMFKKKRDCVDDNNRKRKKNNERKPIVALIIFDTFFDWTFNNGVYKDQVILKTSTTLTHHIHINIKKRKSVATRSILWMLYLLHCCFVFFVFIARRRRQRCHCHLVYSQL